MADKRSYLRTLQARLDARTLRTSCGCWVWVGALTKTPSGGYPQVWHEGKVQYAHRVVYEQRHGPVPADMHICHRCDIPQCVNPDHLFLGTQADNMQDMVTKGRANRPCGEDHYRAKLTRAQVEQIRAIYAQGKLSTRKLAAQFGVGSTTVCSIINRQLWK